MKTNPELFLFSTYRNILIAHFSNFLLLLFLIVVPQTSTCQLVDNSTADDHELTIYVIRSVGEMNWESPSTLYKSYIKAYTSHVFRKKMSLTGHLFVKLSTPLLEEPLYAGMCTPSRKERRDFVLKQKIGLGVLGASMKAKLEDKNDLIKKIDYFSRKNELAFITYHLNQEATSRIIEFYKVFTSKSQINNIPSDYYGGSLWPRYENEGAGCSAFGIAILQIIGVLGEESSSWVRNVNIPMNLIGGKFNEMHKIKSKMIRRTSCWHNGRGKEEIDFVPFSIYDPSMIYNWIIQQRALPNRLRTSGYFLTEESIVPGLSSDRRHVQINADEPIFIPRTNFNLFIKDYLGKLNNIQKESQ